MRRVVLVAAVALATLASGCRAVRAIPIAPEEQAAFRPTRTGETLEERMHAAEAYLARYPAGEFAADVRRSYLRADEALWASKRGSVAGLESYLAALPTGPHAKVARRELDAKRAARVDLLGRGAAKTEAKLAAAATARVRAREALAAWIRRFADPAVFGASMAHAPSDLVVAWSLGLPQPTCTSGFDGGRRCKKLIAETFEIPREGEREMLLEIEVEESAVRWICGVSLSGPELFRRWEEAGTSAPGELDRDQITRDVEALVQSTIETRSGAVPCKRVDGSNALVCGELVVSVGAADKPGGDDGIYLSTAYPCSSP